MPITHDFEYFRPATAPEVVDLLELYQGTASVLVGGTDLVCMMKDGSKTPHAVVDIKSIPGLGDLSVTATEMRVGACVPFNRLIESKDVREKFSLVWEAARCVGSCGLRNRATLVGNIASAVPCLDSAGPFLLYDGEVVAVGHSGERTIPGTHWFVDARKNALQPNEFAKCAILHRPKEKHGTCYLKLGRYSGEDLGQVNIAVMALEGHKYRIAFGSVGPTPIRATKIEAAMNGKPLTDALIAQAQALVSSQIKPITDIRASKEYRMQMAEVMLERALRISVSRLEGRGPELGHSML
jgi:CO/xanthine dehydrogenase FAD-binding subunit